MKNCKLSETRFAKVSRRSELCSGGKRPFEVSKKVLNSRVGIRKGNVRYKNRARWSGSYATLPSLPFSNGVMLLRYQGKILMNLRSGSLP